MDFENCKDVRLATPEDIPDIIRLAKMACEESDLYNYDERKVIDLIRLYFEGRGGIIGVIGDRGENLSACLVLVMSDDWYSSDLNLHEVALFVIPEKRKSDYAKQLMSFAKKSADALGVNLRIGVFHNEKTMAKIRLYQRQFSQKGAYFVYEPQN